MRKGPLSPFIAISLLVVIAVFAIAILSPQPQPKFEHSSQIYIEISSLLYQADSLYTIYEFDSSIAVCKRILAKVKNLSGRCDSIEASIYSILGKSCLSRNQPADAEQAFIRAIKIRQKLGKAGYADLLKDYESLGSFYSVPGHYDQARDCLNKALELRRKLYGAISVQLVNGFNYLALLDHYSGDSTAQQFHFSQGLQILLLNRFISNDPNQDSLLFAIGNQCTSMFYNRQGERYFRQILSGRVIDQDLAHVNRLQVQLALACAISRLSPDEGGGYRAAHSMLEQILAQTEKSCAPNHINTAECLLNLALMQRFLSEFSQAELSANRALAIYQSAPLKYPEEILRLLFELAKDAEGLGRCEEEITYLKKAKEHALKYGLTKSSLYPQVLNSFGNVYEELGQYDLAEKMYLETLNLYVEIRGKSPLTAEPANNLGLLYMMQGDYTKAEEYLKWALSVREPFYGSTHPFLVYSLLGLATVYNNLHEFHLVDSLLQRAFWICQKAYRLDYYRGATLLRQAVIYNSLGRFIEAENLLRQIRCTPPEEHPLTHLHLAWVYEEMADSYMRRNLFQRADSAFQKALEIKRKVYGPASTDENSSIAETMESICQLRRLTNRTAEAIHLAAKACKIRRHNFAENVFALSEREALTYARSLRFSLDNYLSCYFQLPAGESTPLREAADLILQGKGQVSEVMLERQAALGKETDSTTISLVRTLKNKKTQLSNLFVQAASEDSDANQNAIDSLSQAINKLEATLSHRWSYQAIRKFTDLNWDQIRTLLPANAVLVEYLKYDHQQLGPDTTYPAYLALVATRESKPLIFDLGPASEIDSLVHVYRMHMLDTSSSRLSDAESDYAEYGIINERLYGKVWRPIEKFAENKNLVLIAPDGALNLIAFAGLKSTSGKYLVENYPLHYLSCARDLIHFQNQGRIADGLLAMGDPDFDASVSERLQSTPVAQKEPIILADNLTRNPQSNCSNFRDLIMNRLPDSRKEVEAVAEAWKRYYHKLPAIYLGSEASEERLKAKAPGNRIIHLATHGYFIQDCNFLGIANKRNNFSSDHLEENPLLLSGLFLAGANLHGKGADQPGAEDGILTAYEVSTLNLEGTNLVVLSACETGLGEVEAGEGVYGLRRAFQMAGARTVISALWQVSDKWTAEMMSELYQNKGISLPEQIRNLQLQQIAQLRSQGKPDHPFNWAAFIAVGDWKKK